MSSDESVTTFLASFSVQKLQNEVHLKQVWGLYSSVFNSVKKHLSATLRKLWLPA